MLDVRGLTMRFGATTALDQLSLKLAPASFNVLLGPNGAGKSTLFQVLTGLYAPDSGDVEVAGHTLKRAPTQALRNLGVVFQQVSLDLDLSVRSNLQFHADLQGLPRAEARAAMAAGAAQLGLGADLDRRVRELSGGTRRKVELVRALLHQPRVLLMDEATVGLDPKSRRELLAALHADVANRGTCVLWATHWTQEAEGAHRVLLLHRGRLLADGTPEAVTRTLGGASLEDAFIRATNPGEALPA